MFGVLSWMWEGPFAGQSDKQAGLQHYEAISAPSSHLQGGCPASGLSQALASYFGSAPRHVFAGGKCCAVPPSRRGTWAFPVG